MKSCSLPPSQSLGHPHTAPTDLAGKGQNGDFKKTSDVLLLWALNSCLWTQPWITMPKLDPCSPHKQALLLQPSLETRLMAYIVLLTPAGLNTLYETEHCDNPAPDSVGTLPLSHHAMPQTSLTTFHNSWIVCSMCLASPAPVSWSVSSNWQKQTKKKWFLNKI